MKLKSLTQSRGERDVKKVLEDRLAETPYQVWGKVRLGSVIGKEPKEHLPNDLFSYLKSAELDYLIFHRTPPNRPLLAIEFDGPHHEFDPKARKNDLLKNKLCRMAGLPLLRIRYDDIETLFTRDSFLSYIVEIIIKYKTLHEKKSYNLPDLDTFTEKDYDEMHRHEIQGVRELEMELARKHRIFSLEQARMVGNVKYAFEFSIGASDWASSETDEIHEGHLLLWRVDVKLPSDKWLAIHKILKTLQLRTHYRTTDEPMPTWPKNSGDLEALENYVKWLERDPWYFPVLPGVNWLYVAWNLLEGLCIKQLLRDVDTDALQLHQSYKS